MQGDPPQLTSRIPSLDGLRAISILAVVVGHVAHTRGFPVKIHGLEHFGNLGVKVFFVISGFLITTLLLRESANTGGVSLKDFYARRALRIFPAFYAYIAMVFVAGRAGPVELKPGDLLHALTYTMNYHHVRGWALNHLWSLSVEEQFYLVWPLILAASAPRKGLRIAAWVIILAPAIRLVMWCEGTPASAFTREFQAVADVLATGCVLAGAHNWLGRQRRYLSLLSSPLFLLLPGSLLVASFASYFAAPMVFYVFGQTVSNVAIALFIDRTARMPSTWLGRMLNWRPLVFIGTLSYSLYLWQEPFLDPMSSAWFAAFPQNVIFVVVASLISYYAVETQALKLRHRFRRV